MKLKPLITSISAFALLSIGVHAYADPSNAMPPPQPEDTTGANTEATTPSVAEKIESKTKSAARKTERVASDSWITTKVKSSLLADDITKGFKISVKTVNHVVALSGTVDSQASADHATTLAKRIEGVIDVDASGLKVVSKVSSHSN